MYSTGGKRKDNPIEDELVFRVGTAGPAGPRAEPERAGQGGAERVGRVGPEAQNDLCEFLSVSIPSVPHRESWEEKGEFTIYRSVCSQQRPHCGSRQQQPMYPGKLSPNTK